MPLVDITIKPDCRLRLIGEEPNEVRGGDETRELLTRGILKVDFALALPELLIKHAVELRLDPNTKPDGVQVMHHDFGAYDVNIPDVWVKIQFSEECPTWDGREPIRDLLHNILVGWFRGMGYELDDFVVDLFWGPTNGKGTVNGTEIVW